MAGEVVKPNGTNALAFCVGPATTQVRRLNFGKCLIWFQVDWIEPFFQYCGHQRFCHVITEKSLR